MNSRISARQPLVGLALAAMLGILLAEFVPLPIYEACFAVAFLALVSLGWPRSPLLHLLVLGAFYALQIVRQTDAPGLELARMLGDRPRPTSVSGVVATEPKTGAGGFATFLLRLDTIELSGQRRNSAATVQVRWKTTPSLGDEIEVAGLAEPIPPTRNPGAFDLRAYLAREDVYHTVFARYPENGRIMRASRRHLLRRLAAQARVWMQTTLIRGLEDSPEVCSLLSGVVLGLRHETPNDIEEPFQRTGTLHLFAVAGLHVGIVAQLLWILAAVLRLPRPVAAGLIVPFLFFYSAITGLHVSSLRAATMASFLLGGIFVERRVLALNSLAAAALCILAVDPNQLFSSGFQLSFAVVAAIIVGQNKIFRPLWRLGERDPFLPRKLVSTTRRVFERGYGWIARGFSVSAAAWAGSLVLILWYFYLITPISLLANLAVVPMAFFLLGGALLSLLAAPLSTTLSVVCNNANWSLAQVIIGIVQYLAQLPGGHLYVERPHWPAWAETEITVLDAGAGAAVHLRANGRDWLFDAGSARQYEGFLRDYLHSRGIDRLDGLILTHGDALHLGGAAAVLDEFHPRRVLENAAPDRSRVHHQLFVRRNRPEQIGAGKQIQLAPQVVAEILYPPPNLNAKAADDAALVVRLVMANRYRALLLSDAGTKTEDWLMAQPNELKSEVLIKGRHYSGATDREEFLAAVQPELIVATSVDFSARERLPDAWAAAVRARGIRLFRQDETGAVTLRFFHDHWEARPFLGQEIFTSSRR